jgi:hypothetical protein
MVAGGAAIALVFGLLACRAFEVILRVDSEFAASPGTYFRIGVAALVPLIALSVLTAAILGGLAVIALLVRRPARRVWSAWSGLQQRMNPQTVAAAVLVVGTALWLTLTWTYRELFGAMLDLYQHPATASVGAISGASRGAHVQYANASASLSFLLIVAALVWLPRLARRAAEPANIRTLSWGVLALAFVVMLGPTVPRRFLFERFRVMEYAGRPMPEIGRSGTDLLLFDRTRRVTLRVRHDASVLTPTERTELLFGD